MAANGSDKRGATIFGSTIGIGCGAALLISLMVLAAFSLGVVVGNRGLLMGTVQDFGTRPAAGQQPPQQPPGPGQQPPEAPEWQLPAGKPALVGRVGAITNEGLFMQTPQGPHLVEVEKETVVLDQKGQELSLSDLRQGVHLGIFGDFSRDGRRLTAKSIIVLPPPQR